ncbi:MULTISPECIES: Rv0909 family putative TA system antitoxin [Corynebacterium]|uniref:Antitoxin n=2 Tax=Corynebacterium glucuronolyticum TaxID=39791 RepID=A0A7T4EHG9_9CORY|nr:MULTISPECIES: Rv0909 family putative TA system antitoxin [Corynebacterium]EEI26891.1 hypothetical protein HMPREF0294_1515 [Corynebacterium glucuronolyticum ATCC 51867]EEI62171.1 hypothetical protein HMPREF0293_2296 [Corynebacterium glucuronolyticum ATCC 51866]MCT1441587.1 Rv0909 family putative TA system antitoxin [Corynebacterium glucuronolyticum]MCT1562975.1 Rv0909 family putative TA system antitoxin [Corynebacterium glucuronolyticum]OFO42505.1 hypothetical protein HMPREF3044_06245 [Coryn
MGIFNKDDLIEKASDAGLDKLEQIATEKLGADKADQIRQARDAADERIGNRGADREQQQPAPEAPAEGEQQ